MASNSNQTSIKAPATKHPFTFKVSFNEGNYDVGANTSPITITSSMTSTGSSWSGGSHILEIFWFDNNKYLSGISLGVLDLTKLDSNETKSIEKSITVTHKDDGTLSGYARAVFTKASSNNYTPPSTTLNTTNTTLTTIPRASSFKTTNATIEETCTIDIDSASSSFVHTLKYKFGSLSGTIASGVVTSYKWTIPTSFYNQIPNNPSGTCTITCETYNSGTKIGEFSKEINISCDESKCRPNLSVSYEDVNPITVALTGGEYKMIPNYSNLEITPTASAKNGASIKSITVNGISTSSGKAVTINKAPTPFYNVIVTDSRGFQNAFETNMSVVNYVTLTCNIDVYRLNQTDSEVEMSLKGNYFNASFGAVDNTLSLRWAYREKGTTDWINGGTITPTISNNIYNAKLSLESNYDYRKNYEFIVYYSDKLVDTSIQTTVSKGIFDLEIYDGALLMNGIVLFYDKEKYTQLNNNTFERKI